eukprot:GGOE01021180.1.p1 GENE.GGOE01021180.1~~GGOE01021180.1.p1  ORF type:complete len:174 (-),score=41.39 GGOE01021180.1:262-783(-)
MCTGTSASALPNRVVECLGFVDRPGDQHVMKFLTDSRTKKVGELLHQPQCEVVWWFPTSGQQYRFSGAMEVVGADHQDAELRAMRLAEWDAYDMKLKELVLGPTPGSPFRMEATAGYVPGSGARPLEPVPPAPNAFLMLLLRPIQVDHLNVLESHRQVDTLVDGCWHSSRVFR